MSGIIAQNVGRHAGLIKAPSGGGAWTLIQTLTSDGSDSDLSFTSGIDSTYDEYVFVLNNIHPETDNKNLQFNLSDDGGSSYAVTKTSTTWYATHDEGDAGGEAYIHYEAGGDLAQGTGAQRMSLSGGTGADNDQSWSGYLHLYAPSDTTFVKNFMFTGVHSVASDYATNVFGAGYGNTTSAIDAIQFTMTADEIQGGSISMYGIG